MRKIFHFTFVLITIVFFVIAFKNISTMYSADVYAERGRQLFDDGNYQESFQYLQRAVNLNPLEPRYYIARAKTLVGLTPGASDSNTRTYKLLALEDLRTAENLNPNNIITVKGAVSLYYFLATKDLTRPAGPENTDLEFVDITKSFYKHIWNKSPNDVGIFVLLHTYSKRLGFEDLTEESGQKIRELRPDLLEWYNFN
ncbi:tetratricopeptide repeat protein [candidate division WWE3 bacterium]|uniref:Tetratricopeptide repeat protein n=1 Tax=candidate division WWE3 bacterium TaxID=2053526 RepID=A0A7X9DKT5_UNCKA|nr:tetratricopeptide repeat protein [candidate division WWE3 bacterium]